MTLPAAPRNDGELDAAIIGAGGAGTYVAYRLIQARPDWRIAIFERSNRIGGRLWSVPIEGLAHPIELGGMRYMTGHAQVHPVVTELGMATRHFDPAHRPERLFLRGVVGESADDPNAGSGYDLPAGEAGRSANDLMRGAFLSIVPQACELDEALTDWGTVACAARAKSASRRCPAGSPGTTPSGLAPSRRRHA